MVELLVVVVIIGILAGMVLGALQMARQGAREAATKATITKLNNIIMQRYESYMTRRVPIAILAGTSPRDAAVLRLKAIRHLMRMEMPDALSDITDYPAVTPLPVPINAPSGANTTLSEPALHAIYNLNQPTTDFESAQCLYKMVSIGSPEAMEQFNQSEIGVTADGHPVFIDAWGTPICWLRWAPGFNRPDSDIQNNSPEADSDPFDPRRVDVDTTVTPNVPRAYHLIPLVCSAGPDKTFGLNQFPNDSGSARTVIVGGIPFNPAEIFAVASSTIGGPDSSGYHHDNITNHHIEQQ